MRLVMPSDLWKWKKWCDHIKKIRGNEVPFIETFLKHFTFHHWSKHPKIIIGLSTFLNKNSPLTFCRGHDYIHYKLGEKIWKSNKLIALSFLGNHLFRRALKQGRQIRYPTIAFITQWGKLKCSLACINVIISHMSIGIDGN